MSEQLPPNTLCGMLVTIQGKELVELCKKQAEFHRKRQAFYLGEYKRYDAEGVESPRDPDNMKYSNMRNDPKEEMKIKMIEHRAKASRLEFAAAHIDTSQSYLMDDHELVKIGIGV